MKNINHSLVEVIEEKIERESKWVINKLWMNVHRKWERQLWIRQCQIGFTLFSWGSNLQCISRYYHCFFFFFFLFKKNCYYYYYYWFSCCHTQPIWIYYYYSCPGEVGGSILILSFSTRPCDFPEPPPTISFFILFFSKMLGFSTLNYIENGNKRIIA